MMRREFTETVLTKLVRQAMELAIDAIDNEAPPSPENIEFRNSLQLLCERIQSEKLDVNFISRD